MVIELAEYIIDDWSLGGLETCIGVRSKNTDVATPVNPEDKGSWKKLNVVFDVGIARNCVMYCDALFITHGHADHSASLTNALGKRLVASKSESSNYRLINYWVNLLHIVIILKNQTSIPARDSCIMTVL